MFADKICFDRILDMNSTNTTLPGDIYIGSASQVGNNSFESLEMAKSARHPDVQELSSNAQLDAISESSIDFARESKKPLKPLQFLMSWRFWTIFVHGQILSLCIVATNTFTTFLANDGMLIPAFQTLFNYAILNLFFTPYLVYR